MPEPECDTQTPATTAQCAKAGATLDGSGVAVGSFALGARLATGGYVINLRYLGGDER